MVFAGKASGLEHSVEFVLQRHALLAQLGLVLVAGRLQVRFDAVNLAVQLVIFVSQLRKVRIAGLQRVDLVGEIREFFRVSSWGVCDMGVLRLKCSRLTGMSDRPEEIANCGIYLDAALWAGGQVFRHAGADKTPSYRHPLGSSTGPGLRRENRCRNSGGRVGSTERVPAPLSSPSGKTQSHVERLAIRDLPAHPRHGSAGR
jgi:hypothetical protein